MKACKLLHFYFYFYFTLFYFTILYWFCHTSSWIHHGCTWVPNPEPPSHLPPHTISLGHPSAPAPSILYPASNLDWWFISYTILCVSMAFSQIIPPSASPTESKRLSYTSMSVLLSRMQGYWNHLSKFLIYVLVYCIDVFLSGHHHPNTKIWQRCHKKRKLQANITDEHRCKNPQQNSSNQNPTTH